MTNKEYIKSKLSKFNLTDNDIEVILLENSLTDQLDVNLNDCKKAIYSSLTTWIPIHTSISEGGVSESYNIDGIILYYSVLAEELGLENKINTDKGVIRDRSNIW